jgi:DNA invertase Pin-like site-specific DNA recombinase
MGRPWLAYHRISRVGKRLDTPVSEGEFRRAVESYATRKGIALEVLATEKDESGSKMSRPILDAAVRRVEEGDAAGIVVVQYDRLSRAKKSDAHAVIERIEAAGGTVRSVREDFDTATPEGRYARDQFLAMAHMQWERQSAYIRASKRRAVEEGIWPFGNPPRGYTVTRRREGGDGKLRPGDPDEVALVRKVFADRAAGGTIVQAAEQLGVGTSHAWKVIRNRAYLGEIRIRFRDGDEFVNPSAHEPLIDRATWEACQRTQPRPPRRGNPAALLAGLTVCQSCGGSMTPHADGTGLLQYRCPGHPRAGGKRCTKEAIISRAKLDPYVERAVLPLIEDIRVRARARTGDLDRIGRALAEAEAERDLYLQVTKVATVGAEAFMAGAEYRHAEVERIAAELGAVQRSAPEIPDVPDLGTMYRRWPVERRRHLLRGALQAVVVAKGRGPCRDRVWVVDRDGALVPVPDEVGPVGGE